MKLSRQILSCVLVATLLVSGCATMASIPQQVTVVTIPGDADVTLGEIKGVSPMTATVPGGYGIPQMIQIYKDGYQPQTVGVQRGFRTPSLIMDIFPGVFLVFIPLIIDAITGEWWYVANSSYTIRLQPLAGTTTTTSPEYRMERR
jgi:predicted small secreted protein